MSYLNWHVIQLLYCARPRVTHGTEPHGGRQEPMFTASMNEFERRPGFLSYVRCDTFDTYRLKAKRDDIVGEKAIANPCGIESNKYYTIVYVTLNRLRTHLCSIYSTRDIV